MIHPSLGSIYDVKLIIPKEFSTMSAKHAALLTVLMVSAIVFMAVGMFAVDAGDHMVTTDGYGISSRH